MILKGITFEDFVNYKKPSMYLAFPKCTLKCEKKANCPGMCQNHTLLSEPDIDVNAIELVSTYMNDPLIESVVCAGMDPIDSLDDLCEFITAFRKRTDEDIVIYTGYDKNEILPAVEQLRSIAKKKLIFKFGAYIAGQGPHYDKVLGIKLASANQYGEQIC